MPLPTASGPLIPRVWLPACLHRCCVIGSSLSASNIQPLAYGVNYLFSVVAYHAWVEGVFSSMLVDAAPREETPTAWDAEFGRLHERECGQWPTRPAASYMHHIASKSGLHWVRSGLVVGLVLYDGCENDML